MPSFASVLAMAETGSAPPGVEVPPEWLQGRTAYGGFSSALALRAAMGTAPDLPPLRSAQVSLIAPVIGRIEASAQVIRRGRNATWVEARLSAETGTCLIATFVFMGPVKSELRIDERPVPADLISAEVALPFASELLPAFLRENFDVRFARPRAREKEPEVCWWLRLRQREELDPRIEALLVGDGLPPGVMPLLRPPVNGSTMQWQASVLMPEPATDDGWWLLRSRADYAERGCSAQRMDMWNAAGVPVLTGMQSVAVFG